MIAPEWLWIPVTLGAAAAQTLRNAAQRHLSPVLGTLGATLVRFLYGVPFALAWLLALTSLGDALPPRPTVAFAVWIVVSSLAQIGATALLLRVMEERNFALGVAYAKTEVIQVAVMGFVFLGDPLTSSTLIAVAVSTTGVMLIAPIDRDRPLRALLAGWTTRSALLGIASGTLFGIAAVGYRGAALALGDASFLIAAACTLVAAQLLQTAVLGAWLSVRRMDVLLRVLREWRRSLFAGFMGALASACWFTAMAIEPAAHVRTLALVEILFGYAVSRRFFRERVSALEIAGMLLLMVGCAVVTLSA